MKYYVIYNVIEGEWNTVIYNVIEGEWNTTGLRWFRMKLRHLKGEKLQWNTTNIKKLPE